MSMANPEVLTDSCFNAFAELIYQSTGISISPNRKIMIAGRLWKRVSRLNIDSYEDYLQKVLSDPDERRHFIDLITTNETYFFRTPKVWNYIEHSFLPQWIQKNRGKVFKAWSAACSSGEEAYSLAMILQSFKEKEPRFEYRILGTDISQEMIELSRAAKYKGRSLQSFKDNRPEYFQKYLVTDDDLSFTVKPFLREQTTFKQHNLFRDFSETHSFDLVLIRNVFIYFKPEDQAKILNLIYRHINAEGHLIIGESESLQSLVHMYSKVENLIYRKDKEANKKVA